MCWIETCLNPEISDILESADLLPFPSTSFSIFLVFINDKISTLMKTMVFLHTSIQTVLFFIYFMLIVEDFVQFVFYDIGQWMWKYEHW